MLLARKARRCQSVCGYVHAIYLWLLRCKADSPTEQNETIKILADIDPRVNAIVSEHLV
ncbi:hypothetical protein K503DRAFT_46767 [Rhizopogon vinicolor AM-OR11-026]|uniref:Uncharacterized protein n=1 Tax=Rhizopogon vinicolor AM-OR11-026 TaxID=1314800 RepID=A0A1B7MGU7_9AGAM|nr:hypothetical protein K503DRAFT_46767 [Rhizopogon vinicolor AM-OR11-026]